MTFHSSFHYDRMYMNQYRWLDAAVRQSVRVMAHHRITDLLWCKQW